MRISEHGIDFIKHWEGCKLVAYLDGGGVWTIGIGHTGPDVQNGDEITELLAEQLLAADIGDAEECIEHFVDADLNQHEFDALCSLIFNIGCGAFRSSTLLKLLNAGDRQGAKQQFQRWCKDNGKTVQGLLNRRLAEAALFGGVA